MKFIIAFLLPISIWSQTISGTVYDSESTVKGIDVFNLSQKTIAYTDDKGIFSINARIGDTLSFHSLFHNQKIIKLEAHHFNETFVVELRKTINRLNEILLQNNIDPAEFNTIKQKQVIKKNIEGDSKSNPHLYQTSSKYGLDFIRLAGMISELLKKKKKNPENHQASASDLDSIFKKDTFFNQSLLTHNLKIPPEDTQLFFNYCAAHNIDKSYIQKENKLLLLEELLVLSEAFLKEKEESSQN
ncbi:hypothetical protein [Cognatitamlana onchidii]|uniref:hypothetical protein n=1 Tax=Cognatitamlana onchidii TaxID=2562860 RepID=UPI0010A5D342|nr:hypothetical protein [Algibacter onchidii]